MRLTKYQPLTSAEIFLFIAKDVMIARHKELPMSETLPEAIKRIKDWAEEYGFEFESKAMEEIAASLVIPAYDSTVYPRNSTFDQARQNEISEFENLHFAECYTGLTSD